MKRKHLLKLAKEMKIKIHLVRTGYNGEGSWAHLPYREVCIYGWQTQRNQPYLSGLHELAHIELNHQYGEIKWNEENPQYTKPEAEAWVWAIQNSCVKISNRDKEFIDKCITTYNKQWRKRRSKAVKELKKLLEYE